MKKWFQWIFRRGERGVLVLNMRPGDEVACMTTYKGWLAVVSKYGEVYLINNDRFVDPSEVPDMSVWKQ